jgi:L-ornithine N5-oxygenase
VTDQEVDVLAVGAGPANLALAVAIEESGSPRLAERTLLLEQYPDIKWQRNLLLPWARSQVSFLKDLVTMRNPRSRFSFLNFLHETGRLDAFVNLATFNPFRAEISDYLQWVAKSLDHVGVRYGVRCERVTARRGTDGSTVGWTVALSDGSSLNCRDLVIGTGRDPHVPEAFRQLPDDKVIHSVQYCTRIATLPKDQALRVVVVGGAQSAAEMFAALHEDLPRCQPTILVRSIGFQNYQTSKFVNELYFPSFVDEFFDSAAEPRRQILDEMRLTNYAGLAPPFVDELYTMLYRQRLRGERRSTVRALTEVTEACTDGDEVVLTVRDRKSGTVERLRCDVVVLGTGYDQRMPALVRRLQVQLGLEQLTVGRHYRVELDEPAWGGLYVQGVNEQTHGIADSLISVLAHRSQDIVTDMLARRSTAALRRAA